MYVPAFIAVFLRVLSELCYLTQSVSLFVGNASSYTWPTVFLYLFPKSVASFLPWRLPSGTLRGKQHPPCPSSAWPSSL